MSVEELDRMNAEASCYAGNQGTNANVMRGQLIGSADDGHRRYMRQEALQTIVRAMQCGSSVEDLREAIQTVEAFTNGSTLRVE